MQDSKRVLGFNGKRRIEQLKIFDWLSNVKNLVLWNGCDLVRNVIQWIQIIFFSKNLQKSPSGWGLCLQTPVATGVCDTFEYTSLLTHVS